MSATDCDVLGEWLSSSAMTLGAGEWTGSKYLAQKLPKLVPGGRLLGDMALSCGTKNSCLVVGDADSISLTSTTVTPFAATWNGTAWAVSKVTLPKGVTQAMLPGVSCVRGIVHTCTAVGAIPASDGGSDALALGWNGKAYTAEKIPLPAEGQSDILEGASCQSAKSCVAVGVSGLTAGTPSTPSTPLGAEWNGTAWKLTPER